MPGKSAPGEFAALHRSTADEGFHADKLAGGADNGEGRGVAENRVL
jgi:hypothetical protein